MKLDLVVFSLIVFGLLTVANPPAKRVEVEWFRAVNVNALVGTNSPFYGYPPRKNTDFTDRWITLGLRSDGAVVWKEAK